MKRSRVMEKRCPVCEGTGKVSEERADGKSVEIVCPRCDGSGFVDV